MSKKNKLGGVGVIRMGTAVFMGWVFPCEHEIHYKIIKIKKKDYCDSIDVADIKAKNQKVCWKDCYKALVLYKVYLMTNIKS